jgi:hypothetical protein
MQGYLVFVIILKGVLDVDNMMGHLMGGTSGEK